MLEKKGGLFAACKFLQKVNKRVIWIRVCFPSHHKEEEQKDIDHHTVVIPHCTGTGTVQTKHQGLMEATITGC